MIKESLDEGYLPMLLDEDRGREAMEWTEATIGDVCDEPPLWVI